MCKNNFLFVIHLKNIEPKTNIQKIFNSFLICGIFFLKKNSL